MVNSRIEIEQNRQIHLFLRVQQLVFKAETLNFVEVQSDFFWVHLVYCDSSYWLVRFIVHFVEGKGCLTCIDLQLCSLWLEIPWNAVLCMTTKVHSVLSKDVDFIICETIVLIVIARFKPKNLANYVVKRHSKEVASQEKQT